MGHVGLTPQSVHALGGFKVQGRGDEAARSVLADARALEEAGAYAIVLEAIPPDVAARGHRRGGASRPSASAPGRGATGRCSSARPARAWAAGHAPKFAKRFAELGDAIVAATRRYVDEVRAGGVSRRGARRTSRTAPTRAAPA